LRAVSKEINKGEQEYSSFNKRLSQLYTINKELEYLYHQYEQLAKKSSTITNKEGTRLSIALPDKERMKKVNDQIQRNKNAIAKILGHTSTNIHDIASVSQKEVVATDTEIELQDLINKK
jgi:flagellar motor switch/type III secretory pathway protein FliN